MLIFVCVLSSLIVPRFVENFYRAVYESCFCKGTRERQTIVQVCMLWRID